MYDAKYLNSKTPLSEVMSPSLNLPSTLRPLHLENFIALVVQTAMAKSFVFFNLTN